MKASAKTNWSTRRPNNGNQRKKLPRDNFYKVAAVDRKIEIADGDM